MKLQPTRCCSCSYYAQLYYTFAWSFSLAWPYSVSRRGAITCSISAYSTSDNAPMRTRVWRCKTRSFMPSALPHGHFNRFCLPIKIFQYVCPTIHHVSTNSASADNASRQHKFKLLDTFLTLQCDKAHN